MTGSVTVGPRVEFPVDHYPRIRVWDSKRGGDRYVYLHRLTAYAHGLIDDLWSDEIVHHSNKDGWDNRVENLESMTWMEHEQLEPHTGNLSRSR